MNRFMKIYMKIYMYEYMYKCPIYPVQCKVERTLLYLKKFKPLSTTIYISEKKLYSPPHPIQL